VPSGRVLDSHRQREDGDQHVTAPRAEMLASGRRGGDSDHAEDELDGCRREEPAAPVVAQA